MRYTYRTVFLHISLSLSLSLSLTLSLRSLEVPNVIRNRRGIRFALKYVYNIREVNSYTHV